VAELWSIVQRYVADVRGNALWDLTKLVLGLGVGWILARKGWRWFRAVSPDAWLKQQEQFARLGDTATGIRELGVSSRRVVWSVYPKAPATQTDLELFRAQAVLAGQLVLSGRLLHHAPDDPEDAWYELVYLMTLPDSKVSITGAGEGDTHEAYPVESFRLRSLVACAKLAAGERPPKKRLKLPA
jgi:hypothetical protein